MNSLGERIKERRESLNISQQRLADAIGISRSNIVSFEKGRTQPSVDYLIAFAKVLHCRVSDLIGETQYIDNSVTQNNQSGQNIQGTHVKNTNNSKSNNDEDSPDQQNTLMKKYIQALEKIEELRKRLEGGNNDRLSFSLFPN